MRSSNCSASLSLSAICCFTSPTPPTDDFWSSHLATSCRWRSSSSARRASISATRCDASSMGFAVAMDDDVKLTFSISSSTTSRSAASSAGGRLVTSLLSFAAASSTTSMALSGMKRPET